MSTSEAFDFGKNWDEFSRYALTDARISQARRDFISLTDGIPLEGSSFLDIGFGQGLSLMVAASLGAKAAGCDINEKCGEVLRRNRSFFPELEGRTIPFSIGSILDESFVRALPGLVPDTVGGFDIVHSWGVLHHTGKMLQAIRTAASLVRPGGHLVLALYNRHWTSPAWHMIKFLYCSSPKIGRSLMVLALYPVIWIAKYLVTGCSPSQTSRGMDFFYDVIDWVGGYPYEYASIAEITCIVKPLGFESVRTIPARVPTGCNQFIFRKNSNLSS